MLDELGHRLDAAKRHDLLKRLEMKDTNTALAAEAELSLLSAISRVARLKVEPKLSGSSRRPDCFSPDLFPSGAALVEIRALSDDNFSGREAMNRTANIVAGFADRLRKGAGRQLYFEFLERSYWKKRFHRERCVAPDFELTDRIKEQLKRWVAAPDWPNPDRIRVTEGKTDVVIRWVSSTSPHFRVFCSMPPVAYDLEDNPIYKALKKKARQVKQPGAHALRCIFLVDVGCDLLRRLKPMGGMREVSGEAIIVHALKKLSIDIVCVFSPYRERQALFNYESTLNWRVTYFDQRSSVPPDECAKLAAVAARLPAPHFEGYQARDLHRQNGFDPQSGNQHLHTVVSTWPQMGKTSIKISTRLVHEYLAGRISPSQFASRAFHKEKNFFETELSRGNTVQAVRLERCGPDEDDDYLVFDLDFDWGAVPLTHRRVGGVPIGAIKSAVRRAYLRLLKPRRSGSRSTKLD